MAPTRACTGGGEVRPDRAHRHRDAGAGVADWGPDTHDQQAGAHGEQRRRPGAYGARRLLVRRSASTRRSAASSCSSRSSAAAARPPAPRCLNCRTGRSSTGASSGSDATTRWPAPGRRRRRSCTPAAPPAPPAPAPAPNPSPGPTPAPAPGGRTPDPAPGQQLPNPSYGAAVVQQVAAQYPNALRNSCQDLGRQLGVPRSRRRRAAAARQPLGLQRQARQPERPVA